MNNNNLCNYSQGMTKTKAMKIMIIGKQPSANILYYFLHQFCNHRIENKGKRKLTKYRNKKHVCNKNYFAFSLCERK